MARSLRFSMVFTVVAVLAFWGSERHASTQTSSATYGVSDLGTIGGRPGDCARPLTDFVSSDCRHGDYGLGRGARVRRQCARHP